MPLRNGLQKSKVSKKGRLWLSPLFWRNIYFGLEENEGRNAELELYVSGLKQQIEIDREEVQDLIGKLYRGKWIKNKGELTKKFERYIRHHRKDYSNFALE